jgi:hypothetical protein
LYARKHGAPHVRDSDRETIKLAIRHRERMLFGPLIVPYRAFLAQLVHDAFRPEQSIKMSDQI